MLLPCTLGLKEAQENMTNRKINNASIDIDTDNDDGYDSEVAFFSPFNGNEENSSFDSSETRYNKLAKKPERTESKLPSSTKKRSLQERDKQTSKANKRPNHS